MIERPGPLRLGVIGCGRVFERFHLPAIRRVEHVRLIAACDANPARITWADDHAPSPAGFSSPSELLQCPGLEAVLVLTPPETHAGIAIQALGLGLHVLVEKPMALKPGDGSRMVQAAETARRRLQVGFTRRFREPYRRLRRALHETNAEPRGAYFELAFPSSWKSQTDFLGDESRGGGVLDDVVSHQVDLICWLLGGRPDEVRAVAKVGDRGGVQVELRIGTVVAQCQAAHASYVERLEIELAGGRTLEASGSGMRTISTGHRSWSRPRALLMDRFALLRDRLLRRPNVTLNSFELQLRDFYAAVNGGSFDGATSHDGLLAVHIVEACRASLARNGTWQTLAKPAA